MKNREIIQSRLNAILTESEMDRISIITNRDYDVVVDVHGLKCSQARRFINNIINAIRMSFKLIIIHGYNHGTAIKDMLADNFHNDHVYSKYSNPYNRGITYMQIV